MKRCMREAKEPQRCVELFNVLNDCIKKEKELLLADNRIKK